MSNDEESRAWLEVDTGALRANYETMRRVVGANCAVIAMVKADGYGLGAARVVCALEPLEPWGYGVASVVEGVELRTLGIGRPIVVFTPLTPQAVEAAAAAHLTATISDTAALEHWSAAAERHGPLDFHVEIDTGMGRAGFDWRETGDWGERVSSFARTPLRWTGVYSHFHGADAPDGTATATQWERFQDALARLPVSREDLLVHACNSAATLRWPQYAADAIRPGIFLFGGHPATQLEAGTIPAPLPVVSVRARICLIRKVPPGSTVGYGATHVARGWERWATVSIGYGDGVPRTLGNLGCAAVRGRQVPFVGRISMDMLVVDISHVPDARVGDVVTWIGRDGAVELTLDEVAGQAETISYEILTGITRRVKRVER